jgi:hypothetical protein
LPRALVEFLQRVASDLFRHLGRELPLQGSVDECLENIAGEVSGMTQEHRGGVWIPGFDKSHEPAEYLAVRGWIRLV